MSRLADYFAVVGYDHEKDRSGTGKSVGKIIQKFPEKDWPDCVFTEGIELFCQPTGWALSTDRQQPTYTVAVLTDSDADRHYCACLTFHETVAMTPTKPDDSDGDEHESNLVHHSLMFAPKSLVLISRLDYFETFRHCMGIIYSVYIENMQVQLETLVGNILGCVQVPPPGGPQVRFSIGAGDRQALQPPLNTSIPTTHTAVAVFFQQLGIHNAISLFCAALSDQKILFYSQSYTRLTDAAQALLALMYPLKYSYVYIPILPYSLLEVLSTPTPFIVGIHSSLAEKCQDLFFSHGVLDVITVDLDGGSIHIPECVHMVEIPDPILKKAVQALNLILNPDLLAADFAFPTSPKKTSSAVVRDKEIRAIFLRLFAELLQGYRSCLTIIRIHPEPFITFHKANFLGHRGMVEDDFTLRVLDGMSFNTFVSERGPPYRVCDVFDEVYATMQDSMKEEQSTEEKMVEHVKDLANQLYQHECPNPQPYVQKVPRPTEGAYSRIHQPPFPTLNAVHVQQIIEDGIAKHNIKSKLKNVKPHQPRIVPSGPPISSVTDKLRVVDNNARRMEVLRNCVNCIFENKISDARKIFPAVMRALKRRVARQALTHELSYHVQSNRAMLEHQQFDLVVKLLNCALQNDSSMDENGTAAAILPLATAFCRKLCTNVIQFAYTCIQEHPVWANLQFWEATFYQDVQQQIRQLYLPQYEEQMGGDRSREGSRSSTPRENMSRRPQKVNIKSIELGSSYSRPSSITGSEGYRRINSSPYRPREITALEIAAEQLRTWPSVDKEKQEEMINNEESTVFCQAIHYSNRMVYMRVPLDASKHSKTALGYDMESNSNSNITASIAESDSVDAESGFDEMETSEVGASVTKFVTRFVDKVCNESGVTQDHLKTLHQMIPGVVAMHIETLEGVFKESKRLPPIQKPKILTPILLSGEEIIMEGLRAYLIPDGREEGTGGNMGGPTLLPAEGAIFLTNYRIIFKGTPCDPLACEQIVIRSFPVSTLTKEKRIGGQYLSYLNQWLQDGVQLRSNIFQLIKVFFDEEVNSDNVETFRKLVNRVRNPPSVLSTFAFAGQMITQPTPHHKQKEKNASLKQFAKKTIIKTARKAGIKSKQSTRKDKYVLPTPPMLRKTVSPRNSDSESDRPKSELYDDDLSVIDEAEFSNTLTADPKNLEKLMERHAYKDYERLDLGSLPTNSSRSRNDTFRITVVNANFAVSRSYPALLVVPQAVTDDSIRRFSRCNRQCRFPVVTWRHPRTKALLLRASGFHSRGLMGMIKHQTATTPTSGEPTSGSSIEQEKYFRSLVAVTPYSQRTYSSSYSDSLTSLDSLMMAGGTDSLTIPETPDTIRRSAFSRALSKGKSRTLGRIGSFKDKSRMSTASLDSNNKRGPHQNGSIDQKGDFVNTSVQGLNKFSLYVLGEKTQMKGIKVESFPKCDFIPVDFYDVRHVKASFKKLMRACVPSAPLASAEVAMFYKSVEESEWLLQIQNILQLAGATVDLIDVQGSSVMICLEDGWDITTQVVSVAELLMDPYYRTIEGFKVLIEKEWLAFGHRFTHRSNQTAANQASGFAPIFLQFLDVVHQIHTQFPCSFEFNQYFIKFMAYHYVSNRFRTFMLDNEFERMEAGWLLEEKKGKLGTSDEEAGFTPKHSGNNGTSLWEYIDKHHRKSPIFFNFHYSTLDQEVVLRPYSNLSNLKIWEYYLTEDLAHGPSYDIELAYKELLLVDEQQGADMQRRKILNGCYNNINVQQPSVFTEFFTKISKLENRLEHLPLKWKPVYDKLESPHEPLNRQISLNTQLIRSHGRSIHKRSTLEILVRGKMLGEAARVFNQPHRFEIFTFTTPAYCDYCSNVLWGIIKTVSPIGMQCTDCGYNCHDKCVSYVPKNCTKLKVLPAASSTANLTRSGLTDTGPVPTDGSMGTGRQSYAQFSSNVGENRTHEGYLYKRGALLKGWKQRWFVLDAMKHQLRYYDSMEDSNYKGYIDLAEVVSVQAIKNVQSAPKKSDENAFFEMRTMKRVYHFLATEAKTAVEWIDKIQSCIQ